MVLTAAQAGALQPMERAEFGPDGADSRVMIVSEWSRFKARLVDEVVGRLDDGSTRVYVRNFDDLTGMDPEEYSAVLVINAGVGAQVRTEVTDWLARLEYDRNVVLLTTQITDWEPQVTVDSVTTASRMRHAGDVAEDLVARVRRFL